MIDMRDYVINKLCPDFFSTNGLSEKTRTGYLLAIKEFLDVHPDITQISLDDCKQYINGMIEEKKLKYSTIVKKKKQLSSFFAFIDKNREHYPALAATFVNYFSQFVIQPDKEEIKANKVISLDELDRLIGYTHENDRMCLNAIVLSFKVMLRMSELIRLQWSDIFETEKGYLLKITNEKGNSRYTVLPEDVFNVIMEYGKTVPDTSYLFQGKGKKYTVTPKTLMNKLSLAEKKLKTKHYTYNDLRNAGIAYAASQGCPPELLAQKIDLKHKIHLSRLTSLTSLTFSNVSASSFTNIVFTGPVKNQSQSTDTTMLNKTTETDTETKTEAGNNEN